MSSLKDRVQKGKEAKPTDKAIKQILQKKEVRDKYPVNVVFDGELEQDIRDRAKELGLGVATYIKNLVARDLK